MSDSEIEYLNWETFDLKKEAGVYMLMGEGGVLYIGQSINIHYRIGCHLQDGRIPFKWVKIAKTSKRDMDAIEQYLIKMHDPPYNHTYTTRAGARRGPQAFNFNQKGRKRLGLSPANA
jgi:excinuclease UvrABC nuclease subunit